MYQAWNYIGFANRHLGNYDAALSAYAKALEINPAYPEAIGTAEKPILVSTRSTKRRKPI